MAANFPSSFRSLCNSATRLLGRPLCKAVIIGLIVSALGLAVSFLPVGNNLEEQIGLSVLFTMRGARRPPPPVVVVALDRASAEHLHLPSDPKKWIWTQHWHTVRVHAWIENGIRCPSYSPSSSFVVDNDEEFRYIVFL